VRLQLFALAYNRAVRRANFMRRLALPEPVRHWSLIPRMREEKLVKIGAKVVCHARYVVFQMGEVAVPRELFGAILQRIQRLSPAPTWHQAVRQEGPRSALRTQRVCLERQKPASRRASRVRKHPATGRNARSFRGFRVDKPRGGGTLSSRRTTNRFCTVNGKSAVEAPRGGGRFMDSMLGILPAPRAFHDALSRLLAAATTKGEST
jgi:hypothetical protein